MLALFGGRLFGWVPGTHLGAVVRPGPQPPPVHPSGLSAVLPLPEWHYWWQAHFVDCLIDAIERRSAVVDPALARRHVRGMWLRNGFRFRNSYYDDMAWLALAAQRSGRPVGRLDPILRSAITDDVEGGAFWHSIRDFKNTAATGPIALHLARSGDHRQARALIGWLKARLMGDDGLFADGLRLAAGEPVLVEHVFTYNQGPALATMLVLGDQESLSDAASLIDAIAGHLVTDGGALRTHGDGDGGLFTGVLARYLALAARHERLPGSARATAAHLVRATEEALWRGSVTRGWRGEPVTVFPTDTVGTAVPERVELSTQLQAWMVTEAALALPRRNA